MKKKIRFGLIAAIPLILCIIAVSVRVAVPKSGKVTIQGTSRWTRGPIIQQVTGEVTSLPAGVGRRSSRGTFWPSLTMRRQE
jgi:hypothetical protein